METETLEVHISDKTLLEILMEEGFKVDGLTQAIRVEVAEDGIKVTIAK